jgi:hypothetical protein
MGKRAKGGRDRRRLAAAALAPPPPGTSSVGFGESRAFIFLSSLNLNATHT